MSDTRLHDWTRVDAGVWHMFHLVWIAELSKQLNGGLLPEPYYAQAEPQGGFTVEEDADDPDPAANGGGPRRFEGDLLTLRDSDYTGDAPAGGVALADSPPRVRMTGPLSGPARRIAVRHSSGDRTVALIELVSPGNRDGRGKVASFCDKIAAAIRGGVHVLLVDLFPPNALLPTGMHGAVMERFDGDYLPPDGEPLACAAYRAARGGGTTFVEPLRVGDRPPTMPLFLRPTHYVDLPLAPGYAEAYRPTPAKFRRVLEAA